MSKMLRGLKKNENVLKSTMIVAILVLLGKVLGFAREAIIAAIYGADISTDAFFFAQSMPSMIFPTVGNSLVFAFTPLLVEKLVNDKKDAKGFSSRVIQSVFILGIILGGIGFIFAPQIVPFLAPGFNEFQTVLSIKLTRIMMSVFFLNLLHYILGAVLNAQKIYYLNQFAALAYNLTIIILTLILADGKDMVVLTSVVVIGMLVQCICLMVFTYSSIGFSLQKLWPNHEIISLYKMALPILLGQSVVQINNIVDKALSSNLAEGSMSALSYASTLHGIVIDVFVISLSSVMFPVITEYVVSKAELKVVEKTSECISLLSLVLIPISFITCLDSNEIVTMVYGRGNFEGKAIEITALVLQCYSFRFVFAGVREVLVRIFFSLKNTRIPMIITIIGVGANIIFSIILVKYMGLAGIALGTTFSVVIIAVLLLIIFKTKFKAFSFANLFRSLGVQIVSGIIMTIILLMLKKNVWIHNAILQFSLDTIIGFAIYIFMLKIFRSKELPTVMMVLKRRK